MRLLLTLHNFLPERLFGAEKACIAQMRELVRAGHTVGLFYAGNVAPSAAQLEELGIAGVALFRVGYRPTKAQVLISVRKPAVERAFARALAAFRPDVVVFHHLVRLSLVLPVLARQAGVPSVYFLHDFYWVCPSYSLYAVDSDVCPGGSPLRCARCLFSSRFGRDCPPGLDGLAAAVLWARNWAVRRAVGAIDLFISPSAAVPREMAARGLSLAPLAVIPLGGDVGPVTAHEVRHEAPRFGYLGGIHPKKGTDVLARAFAGDLGQRLTIRGFPDEVSRASFRASHPGFRGRLELFSPTLTDFYRDVDVFVVPSVWLENQPMVVIEAFSHGRPVLASRIGGLTEMFQEGKGGRFFEAGDSESLRQVAIELSEDLEAVRRLAETVPRWPSWRDVTASLLAHLGPLVTAGPGRA